jgi:hypothetical protein
MFVSLRCPWHGLLNLYFMLFVLGNIYTKNWSRIKIILSDTEYIGNKTVMFFVKLWTLEIGLKTYQHIQLCTMYIFLILQINNFLQQLLNINNLKLYFYYCLIWGSKFTLKQFQKPVIKKRYKTEQQLSHFCINHFVMNRHQHCVNLC